MRKWTSMLFASLLVISITPSPKIETYKLKQQYFSKTQKENIAVTHIGTSIIEESYKEYKLYPKKKKSLKKAKKSVKKVSEYEVYLLAKLIYCEVGSIKDDRCLELCGSVVLNRMKDKRYPNTMQGVIFQKGQYEVTWNGAWNYKKPDKRCLKIARKLLKKGAVDKRVTGMSERVWGKFHSRYGNVVFSIC